MPVSKHAPRDTNQRAKKVVDAVMEKSEHSMTAAQKAEARGEHVTYIGRDPHVMHVDAFGQRVVASQTPSSRDIETPSSTQI